MKHSRFRAATCLLVAATVVSGCGPEVPGDDLPEQMGNATPAPSPASADPAGSVLPFDAIEDLDTTDGVLAVRTATAHAHDLADACGDVSASGGAFAIGCGDTIMLVRADDPARTETLQVEEPVTAATVTTGGDVLAGSDSERKVWLYHDGELADTFSVARETDQLQAVPVDGQADSVVRVNRFDTTIQDIDWGAGRQGGTLRVGRGVGKVAGGSAGLVLAADATGSQLLVYTTDDIIRLHQMAPVPEGPWDVTWDESAQLAWITSTATNTATGYDISRGVPLKRGELATVADAQSIVALDDATLLIASATGEGLQIVAPADRELDELPPATASATQSPQETPGDA